MIPLAVPAALKAVPWKLVGTAVVLVALFAFVLLILHWRRDSVERLPAAQEALEREIKCGEGSECLKRVNALQAQAEAAATVVLRGYEDEIKALRDRPVRVRTVRLCREADSGDVRGPGAPGAPDATGAPGGVVHGPAGPDLGPDLYRLARDADEVAARLRALQEWNAALAGK